MLTLHEIYNKGGVFAPLVVVGIHLIAALVIYAICMLITRPLRWITRIYRKFLRRLIDRYYSWLDKE